MSYFTELQLWRFIGSASWHCGLHAAISVGALWAMGSAYRLFSIGILASLLFLHALQLAVMLAHKRLLSSAEIPPLQLPWFQGQLRPISLFLSRILLRGSFSDFCAVCVMYAATFICSIAYLTLFPSITRQTAPAFGCTLWAAAALSTTYCTTFLLRSEVVLKYPLLHRHRYFRVKSRLLPDVALAVRHTALSLSVYLLWAGLPTPISSLPAIAVSSLLCVTSWVIGNTMLLIVFTEKAQMGAWGDVDPSQLLVEGLGHADPTIQDLALLDLATFSEDRGSAMSSARRAAFFADEAGRAVWTPVAGYLLGELRDFVTTVAAGLPSSVAAASAPSKPDFKMNSNAAAAGSGGGGGGLKSSAAHVQWNRVSLTSAPLAMGGGSRKLKDVAAWAVRTKSNRVSCSLRALSGLAAASRTEDRYGVVLLCEPTLADMLAVLCSTVLAMQQYIKQQHSAPPRDCGAVGKRLCSLLQLMGWMQGPQVDQTAFAIEDLARCCLYRVVIAFGPSLKAALKDMRLKPVFGSKAELEALLNGMLDYAE